MKFSEHILSANEARQRFGVLQSSGALRVAEGAQMQRRFGLFQLPPAFTLGRPLLWVLLALVVNGYAQEPAKKDETPVPFPKLEHFAALWERSIFTTKDLPSPDAPSGPNFADNYNISGVYEFDGAVTFVLVDKTTSQFMEARIGAENEFGVKVRAVKQGETVEKTRVQLQKGDQAGWVSFADASAAPPEVVQRAVIPTQQPSPQGTQRRTIGAGLPPNPILPPPSVPVPSAAPPRVNDVPLPPP